MAIEEKKTKALDKDEQIISGIYKEFKEMREIMTKTYPEFNNRTLVEFINDSQKRVNAYVLTREEQGKDEWQANVFTQFTRNKIKAQIASVAKRPPDIAIRAMNENNEMSVKRSEVMKNLVLASYIEGDSNPEEEIFFDGWDGCINGTIIKFDGYLKVKAKVKEIKSYDTETHEVEVEEKEVEVENRPIEINVPLENFYIGNAYIREIQKQPKLIWVRYVDKDEFDFEFSKYKNADKVKEGGSLSEMENALFFGEQWSDRVEAKKVEVLYYFNKRKDEYRIIANGVLLLDSPLLWGKKRKKYPFAKGIYEPFANSSFFWGNSLPNVLMGSQDIANAFINSMVDKTYRSLETPMLVGMVNKDALELEDEYVTGDTKIYVDDINQVKPMPIAGITQGEMNMLNVISRGIDQASTDALQGGQGGEGGTAREVVLANERAEELKGLFFLMLKGLWLQKVRLRILNILMNYSQPIKVEKIVGEDGSETFKNQYKTAIIPNTELSNTTGMLQIGVAEKPQIEQLNQPIGFDKMGKPFNELDVREETLRMQGKPVEIMMISSDYLDDWEYDTAVETETFYQSNKILDKSIELEKVTTIQKAFPTIFQANQIELFKDLIKQYGDSAEKYKLEEPAPAMPPEMGGTPAGMPANAQQVAAPTNVLPKLGNL